MEHSVQAFGYNVLVNERIPRVGLVGVLGTSGLTPKQLAEVRASEDAIIAKLNRLLKYHDLLSKKYARAARYPWLAVAPDPPEPD
jgi:hypothetical protein